MKKKQLRNLAALALAGIITASAIPAEAYADECGTELGSAADDNTADAESVFSTQYTEDDHWSGVDDELSKDAPIIAVSAGEAVPAEVFEKIKNSGKEVVLDYGEYSWVVSDFVEGYTSEAVDLTVSKVDEKDWADVVQAVKDHLFRMQISIPHNDNFGFTASLKLDLSEDMPNESNCTYYANLYQLTGGLLKWNSYSEITEENGKRTAKFSFTHASDWLITIDEKIDPGKGGSSGGSGSSGRYRGIKKARTLNSEGWTNIVKEIVASESGEVINIELNDETTMPEDALQAAIDNNTKLILDAGFGRVWTINGADAVPGKYIDLSVSGVNVDIPEEAYAGISCADSRQLKLNARLLDFTAQLTAFVGADNIGQNAALYCYNEETGKLVFEGISVVDGEGNVIFDINYGGRFFIAIGSEVAAPRFICGDVNGDGTVNAIDASDILKYAAYGYPLDKRCGDTNADGRVNAHDALPILHYSVGNVMSLPVYSMKND